MCRSSDLFFCRSVCVRCVSYVHEDHCISPHVQLACMFSAQVQMYGFVVFLVLSSAGCKYQQLLVGYIFASSL